MRIDASKTKVKPALIPDEQLDDEPLENDDKFKYLALMFVAKGQGTEEIRPELALFLDIRPMRYWQEMVVAYQIAEITRISDKHNAVLCILAKA